METPREKLKKIKELNGNDGYYGTHNQFAILIENDLYSKASKIMNSLNHWWLWVNERAVHEKIYNLLLDGVSIKNIKSKFKQT